MPTNEPLNLDGYVWGMSHEEIPDDLTPSTSPKHRMRFLEHLGRSSLWTVLGLADLLLPPFRSTSTSSAEEWKASHSIPQAPALRYVVQDPEWIEEVQVLARKKWDLMADSLTTCTRANWAYNSTRLGIRSESMLEQFHSSTRDNVFDETSAVVPNLRAMTEPLLMNPLLELVNPPDLSPPSFSPTQTQFDGGGVKTALVQLSHAEKLQNSINVPRRRLRWSNVPDDGIFTQAYEALGQMSADLPAANVVQLGSPSHWCMAYALPGTLVVSKWYSVNPQQTRKILAAMAFPGAVVHQGHLLRQKMALTVLEDGEFFHGRSVFQSRPSRLNTISETVVRWARFAVDGFTRLSELLLGKITANLDLDGPHVHIRCTRSTPNFCKAPAEIDPFRAVQSGKVWSNGDWYIKIPSGVNEMSATREVSSVSGVVEFGAEMTVTTGEHKGKKLLATRTAGEREGCAQDRLEDLKASTKAELISALRGIHAAGWHHHDVHPANIVILDGKASIIDFGRAVPASQCTNARCSDAEALVILCISPS
ncbi:hypothetical protein B0H11DRAFT_1977674 [Mycena galericulata]|nr:hypothetical protein B0H11DRAFT_1977674 [Mycena galericulata]